MRGQKKDKVLVLGNDNRSFLSVIRSLGRKNIEVYIGWCERNLAASYSRYVKRYLYIPPFSVKDNHWLKNLTNILQYKKFSLVIPCNDNTLLPLALYREHFEKYALLAIPSKQSFDILFDKFETNELARKLDIPVPREIRISNLKELDLNKIINSFRFPIVLKPREPFNLITGYKNFVHKAYNREELEFYLKSMLNNGEVLIQKNFIGSGVGVEILAHSGKILYAFQHVRIHEPLMGGGSSYRKSAPIHPELLSATKKIVKALNYTGVAMVEFKYNFKTNQWQFMEINGRFWGSLPLAISSGADFPYYLFQMLVNKQYMFPAKYKIGIYCRNWINDITWFLTNLRADKTEPTLATLPIREVIKEIKNVISLKERSDTFALDDPMPALVELLQFFWNVFIIKLLRIKIKIMYFSRGKISRKIIKSFKQAKTVLFVCRGNICRSPFAEFYARKIFSPEKRFISAGYYPEINRITPESGLIAAKKFGVDLSTHRSKIVSKDMIKEADILFVFDENNYVELVKKYPESKRKTYLLGFVLPHINPVIFDPYNQNITIFRSTYKKIVSILDKLFTCYSNL